MKHYSFNTKAADWFNCSINAMYFEQQMRLSNTLRQEFTSLGRHGDNHSITGSEKCRVNHRNIMFISQSMCSRTF